MRKILATEVAAIAFFMLCFPSSAILEVSIKNSSWLMLISIVLLFKNAPFSIDFEIEKGINCAFTLLFCNQLDIASSSAS